MSAPSNQLKVDSEDLLFRRYVLERNTADMAQLYQMLFPQLVNILRSKVSSQTPHFYDDVVAEKLNELILHPEKFWTDKSRPPQVMAILSRSVQRLAIDKIRKIQKTNTIAVELQELNEIADNQGNDQTAAEPTDRPSVEAIEKLLKMSGLHNEAMLADFKEEANWKVGEAEEAKAKLDYELLAKKHQTSVNTMQQRVKRYRAAVYKKFGGTSGFMLALRTLAWIRKNFPRILAWSFICVAGLASLLLLKKPTPNALTPQSSQNTSVANSAEVKKEMTPDRPNQNTVPANLNTNSLTAASPNSNKVATPIVEPHFSVLPSLVIFHANFWRQAEMDRLTKLFKKDSVNVEFLIEIDGYPGPDCEITYAYYREAWPEALDCAQYVQYRLMQEFPDRKHDINISIAASIDPKTGLMVTNNLTNGRDFRVYVPRAFFD